MLRHRGHSSSALQYAWNIHGESAFEFSVLENGLWDSADRFLAEARWIEAEKPAYNTKNRCMGKQKKAALRKLRISDNQRMLRDEALR